VIKRYYSFLLRMWESDAIGPSVWRASLENPLTRQVLGFETLEAMQSYLEQLAQDQNEVDAPESTTDLPTSYPQPLEKP